MPSIFFSAASEGFSIFAIDANCSFVNTTKAFTASPSAIFLRSSRILQ